MRFITSILLITLIFTTTFVGSVQAANPSPATAKSASPSANLNEKLNQQINQLKDKIASRVTELNLVEKRGMIGTVSEVSANQITMTNLDGKTRLVDVDEITKFASVTTKGSFGLSDLVKGTQISVLGLYNKDSKRTLARFIETTVTPVFLTGAIADIDSKNFQITIQTEDQKQTKIDIESSTKISVYTKKDDLTKYGFSKLAVGDRVSVIGYPNKKDSSLVAGSRVVVLSGVPKNPKIAVKEPVEATPTEEVVPTASKRNPSPTKTGPAFTQ